MTLLIVHCSKGSSEEIKQVLSEYDSDDRISMMSQVQLCIANCVIRDRVRDVEKLRERVSDGIESIGSRCLFAICISMVLPTFISDLEFR